MSATTSQLITATYGSPMGDLMITARGSVLCALSFIDPRTTGTADTANTKEPAAGDGKGAAAAGLADTRREPAELLPAEFTAALDAYFAGDLGAIEHLAAEPEGTPFQKQVWAVLRTIPAGTTATYGQIAAAIGAPTAARAVGMANGKNPVAIVIPCHRIIGASGALTGYGGGMERKRWLLAHEGVLPSQTDLFGDAHQI